MARLGGLVTVLSATLSRPETKPTLVGLDCTLTAQVPPAAMTRLGVQVVVAAATTNGPVTVSGVALSVIETPVLLVRVILVAVLGIPTAVVGKVIDDGDSATLLLPVPLRPMSWGLEGSLSLTTTAPLFGPVDFGVKWRVIVQLAPAASAAPEAGQVLLTIP